MTEKRKPGRPATGRTTPGEARQNLLDAGGRIIAYRIKPDPAAALAELQACGEFKDATSALDASLIEAAKRRKLKPENTPS